MTALSLDPRGSAWGDTALRSRVPRDSDRRNRGQSPAAGAMCPVASSWATLGQCLRDRDRSASVSTATISINKLERREGPVGLDPLLLAESAIKVSVFVARPLVTGSGSFASEVTSSGGTVAGLCLATSKRMLAAAS